MKNSLITLLTDARTRLPRPRLLYPRAESLSKNAIPTRRLCVHTQLCVCVVIQFNDKGENQFPIFCD